MIKVKYEQVASEIQLSCGDATSINFILSLYPSQNLKFMGSPVGLDKNGNSIEVMSLKSRYKPIELPLLVDERNINELSRDVKTVLDEFFEFIGDDKEVYLYAVILSCHGCKVLAYFSQ